MFVIAIDGPAASGKSTVSHLLAQHLHALHVNSGAFYRAVTWAVLAADIHLTDENAISTFIAGIRIDFDESTGALRLNGTDLEPHLRDPLVNDNVSRIASYPAVRLVLTTLLQSLAQIGPLVMEGRDIGSVVFPDTPYKFYIDASEEVRASRRTAQGEADSIAHRDAQDSSRKSAPLVIAEDAHVVDTSHLSLKGVMDVIMTRLHSQGLPVPT